LTTEIFCPSCLENGKPKVKDLLMGAENMEYFIKPNTPNLIAAGETQTKKFFILKFILAENDKLLHFHKLKFLDIKWDNAEKAYELKPNFQFTDYNITLKQKIPNFGTNVLKGMRRETLKKLAYEHEIVVVASKISTSKKENKKKQRSSSAFRTNESRLCYHDIQSY